MRPLARLALCAAAAALLAGRTPSAFAQQRLTSGPGAKQTSINFARNIVVGDVAGPGGQVQVIWFDDRSGIAQVYAKRSLDGGTTWGPDVQLSQPGVRSEQPALARSGRHVYAAWHAYLPQGPAIVLRHSQDGGATWGPGALLGAGGFPSVAASGSRARVVWSDPREGATEVYTRGSADAAATWDAEVRLSDVPYDSWVPTVELAGKRAYVGWVDYRDGNEEEYFRRSTDGGATWGPAARLTADPADSWAPSIAAAGDTLRLAWFDRRDSPVTEVRVERKLDEALTLLGLPAPPPPPRDPAVYYLPVFMARVQAEAPGDRDGRAALGGAGGRPRPSGHPSAAVPDPDDDLELLLGDLPRALDRRRRHLEPGHAADLRPRPLDAPLDRRRRLGDRPGLVRRPGRRVPGLPQALRGRGIHLGTGHAPHRELRQSPRRLHAPLARPRPRRHRLRGLDRLPERQPRDLVPASGPAKE